MSQNDSTITAEISQDAAEVLQAFQRSYDKHREQLLLVIQHTDAPIDLKNSDGEDIRLEPGTPVYKGLIAGIKIALEHMPPFPLDMKPISDEEE